MTWEVTAPAMGAFPLYLQVYDESRAVFSGKPRRYKTKKFAQAAMKAAAKLTTDTLTLIETP